MTARTVPRINTSVEELRRVRNTCVGKDYVQISTKFLHMLCTFAIDHEVLAAEQSERATRKADYLDITKMSTLSTDQREPAAQAAQQSIPSEDGASESVQSGSLPNQYQYEPDAPVATPYIHPFSSPPDEPAEKLARRLALQPVDAWRFSGPESVLVITALNALRRSSEARELLREARIGLPPDSAIVAQIDAYLRRTQG